MAMDIFSSFDDHNKTSFFWLIWITPFLTLSLMMKKKSLNSPTSFYNFTLSSVTHELVSRTQTVNLAGTMSSFSAIFLTLIFLNFMGLTPYMFSSSSHLAINLALSLPLWISIIMMGASFNLTSFLAHFQPSGSPAVLNPFLCIIELISNMIRPITLAVRLTANLSTGHILMGLLGSAFSGSMLLTSGIITFLGIMYFMFEMAVCIIQAYIFTLLPTLYADEHPM